MARIDAQLLLSENQPVDGASTNSSVIDLGSTGGFMHPLYFDVKLTTPMTAGKITKVKVQSSATKEFSDSADEVEVSVPASLDQTRACTVAQFFSPIKYGNRYIRLAYTAEDAAAGGKVFAYMTDGVQVTL